MLSLSNITVGDHYYHLAECRYKKYQLVSKPFLVNNSWVWIATNCATNKTEEFVITNNEENFSYFFEA